MISKHHGAIKKKKLADISHGVRENISFRLKCKDNTQRVTRAVMAMYRVARRATHSNEKEHCNFHCSFVRDAGMSSDYDSWSIIIGARVVVCAVCYALNAKNCVESNG